MRPVIPGTSSCLCGCHPFRRGLFITYVHCSECEWKPRPQKTSSRLVDFHHRRIFRQEQLTFRQVAKEMFRLLAVGLLMGVVFLWAWTA